MAFSWGFALGSETLVMVYRVVKTVENYRVAPAQDSMEIPLCFHD